MADGDSFLMPAESTETKSVPIISPDEPDKRQPYDTLFTPDATPNFFSPTLPLATGPDPGASTIPDTLRMRAELTSELYYDKQAMEQQMEEDVTMIPLPLPQVQNLKHEFVP